MTNSRSIDRYRMNSRHRSRRRMEMLEYRLVLDSTVVFNEIMYHPAVDDLQGEWIEFHNQMSVDMDVSNWRIDGGVTFQFPERTTIPGGGYVVVAKKPQDVNVPPTVPVFGPFDGRLSNSGEELRLRNRNDRVMDSIDYRDRGPWPDAADGTGASLAKRNPQSGSAQAANWIHSARIGGTPGRSNFVEFDPTPLIEPIVTEADLWRYSSQASGDWETRGFDDQAWQVGAPIFYSGEFSSFPTVNADNELRDIQPITISNPSFEANTNFGVGYGRVTGWEISGATGVNPSLSGSRPFWDNGQVVDGQRVAFLQSDGSRLSQFITGFQPEQTYVLEVHYNARVCCNIQPKMTVTFAGQTLIDNVKVAPAGDSEFYTAFVRFSPNVLEGTLEFENTGGNGDHTLLLDSVAIFPISDEHVVVANPSFEASGEIEPDPGYVDAASIAGWRMDTTGGGRIGISRQSGSLHDNGRIAHGEYAIFLEGRSAISQRLSMLEKGSRYEIRFDVNSSAQRPIPQIELLIDGQEFGRTTITPVEADNRYGEIVRRFVAPDSEFDLQVVQHVEDAVLFVDNVRIQKVDSPLVTELDELTTTTYFRHAFEFDEDAARTDLALSMLVDDGAVVFLNGKEIWRVNMPSGELTSDDIALSETVEPQELTTVVKNADLVAGENVFAVEVHQASLADVDAAFAFTATAFKHPRNPNADLPSLAINEVARQSALRADVEITNFGGQVVLLDDYVVQTNDRLHRLSGVLAPHQSKTFELLTTGIGTGLVALIDPAQSAVVDAIHAEDGALARSPDGTGEWFWTDETTPDAPNQVELSDAIVITEIMYHHQPSYVEYAESNEEWIEIFNRSDETVDLGGWRFEDAIDFHFPDGTRIAPGEFLVVSNDADKLRRKFPDARIIGDFQGVLSNRDDNIRLVDRHGNRADEVHYFDYGRWPQEADGGGASLELTDVRADNASAQSWAASRETGSWKEYRFRVPADSPPRLNVPPTRFHEVIFGLLDVGQVLLDDVKVVDVNDQRRIDRMPNGDFESNRVGETPEHWRIIGNHHGTVVIDPDVPSNHVLQLTATGPTEHMSNHAEVTFANRARINPDSEYEISFRAKWISGSPLFNSRLYFARGMRTTILETDQRNGTPGLPNDNWIDNRGPTYSQMIHSPIVPTPNDPVTVTIRASDPDGIDHLSLYYSVDENPFVEVPMELLASGRYAATIPEQRSNDIVQFYVHGVDQRGAESMFPAQGPDSAALYRVKRGQIDDSVHSFRLIMKNSDVQSMHLDSNVMSNERVGATVIYNDAELFYDVGVRLRASGFGRRGPLAGFNIQFQPDHLFRGVHRSVAIDRGVVLSNGNGGGVRGTPGASPHELLIYQIAMHAGGIAGMYDDVVYIDAPRANNSGLALLKMARYTDEFLDSQFEDGSDGSLYKFELFYYATETVDGNPESLKRGPNAVVGTDITDLGDDKEAYRLPFILKNNRDRDDFTPVMRLGKAFSLPSNRIAESVEDVIDVDQWMRTFAMTSLVGTADTYNMGLSHNLYLYERPQDGRVLAFPWDVDHGFFYSPRARILGAGSSNLRKVIGRPQYRRLFYKHLLDIVQTTYNVDYLTPWIEHYTSLTRQDLGPFFRSYVANRSQYVIDQLERVAPQIPFQITTNDGNPIETTEKKITLEGKGWIDVHRITVNGQPVSVTWIDQDSWKIETIVDAGKSTVSISALDYHGRDVGSDSIEIVSRAVDHPAKRYLRVSEIHYHPADPSSAESSANPDWDANDFEFIEFVNTSTMETISLVGIRFMVGDKVAFEFSEGVLKPNERFVLVANLDAFQMRYGKDLSVLGEYVGRLSNRGELIQLVLPDGEPFLSFAYSDESPWPQEADGDGFSLEIVDPAQTPRADFGNPRSWQVSAFLGGTPGRPSQSADLNGDGFADARDIDLFCRGNADDVRFDFNQDGRKTFVDMQVLIEQVFKTTFGDANLDGKFDSSDLVAVFQAAQYEDAVEGNSNWSTGDWNCDGEFTTSDLVTAFQAGSFVRLVWPL